jgi:hypothetical protein
MTKFLKIMASMLMIAAFAAVAVSCSKDEDPSDPNDPNSVVPDPEGTITANISPDTRIIVRDVDYNSNVGNIGWTRPDNFDLYSDFGDVYVSICDLGEMKGLGNITSIPSTGYTTPTYAHRGDESVACEAGHGYVVKFEIFSNNPNLNREPIYTRLYVVEPIVSTVGGIMGAKVKYYY